MTPHLQTKEANDLGDAEITNGLIAAGAFAVLTLASMIVGTLASIAMIPDWAGVVFVATFAVGGAIIALLVLLAYRRSRRHRADAMDEYRENGAVYREVERKKIATPTQAPPAQSVPAVTSGVDSEATKQIEGIDVRDLRYFCEQIVSLKDWTERRWLGITLPHGYELSKGENGGYNRLILLFIKYRIIVDRTPRNTGKLTSDNVDVMMRALQNQSGAPTLSASTPTERKQE